MGGRVVTHSIAVVVRVVVLVVRVVVVVVRVVVVVVVVVCVAAKNLQISQVLVIIMHGILRE